MDLIARAASSTVLSAIVSKRCGNKVWSMVPTVTPSDSSQIVRVCLPSTFMLHVLSYRVIPRFSGTQKPPLADAVVGPIGFCGGENPRSASNSVGGTNGPHRFGRQVIFQVSLPMWTTEGSCA